MSQNNVRAMAIAKPGRAVNITVWVVQVLLAAFFVFAAMPKLLGDPATVASFHTTGFGEWFRYLTGSCEVAGAVGLLIPRLSGLAAIGLVGLMVGATLTNLFLLPDSAPVAVVTILLGVVFGLIAKVRWPQTVALAGMLRR
ncbi:MAG: DoxX family protein [Actinocatenispora sp.]